MQLSGMNTSLLAFIRAAICMDMLFGGIRFFYGLNLNSEWLLFSDYFGFTARVFIYC